ncbi:hypothetical protein EYF80_033988 [Liparis tanakae]|uniref:Uncharacterized protein n=1 Tax=Liparis tanakae TaxID=230148 RepID=A0A4Z2GQS5_9TELE|nr:hypothetical protein EYF80_033988 [Liparis tanakae]
MLFRSTSGGLDSGSAGLAGGGGSSFFASTFFTSVFFGSTFFGFYFNSPGEYLPFNENLQENHQTC